MENVISNWTKVNSKRSVTPYTKKFANGYLHLIKVFDGNLTTSVRGFGDTEEYAVLEAQNQLESVFDELHNNMVEDLVEAVRNGNTDFIDKCLELYPDIQYPLEEIDALDREDASGSDDDEDASGSDDENMRSRKSAFDSVNAILGAM